MVRQFVPVSLVFFPTSKLEMDSTIQTDFLWWRNHFGLDAHSKSQFWEIDGLDISNVPDLRVIEQDGT